MACAGGGAAQQGRAAEAPRPSVGRARCEGDAAFAYVPDEAFVRGSDARERAYGYAVSAEAEGGGDPARAAAALARLRAARWFDAEAPRAVVRGRAACIARRLVTNREYGAFVRATGHRAPGMTEAAWLAQGFLAHPFAAIARYAWRGGAPPPGEDDHPAVLVSRDDALAYAAWRARADGRRYALPDADAWEHAARGADGRYFPWGDAFRGDATNWLRAGLGRTSAPGAFPASRGPYGHDDMAGDVFQWTATRGARGPVLKGCGWDDLPGFCRGAYAHSRPASSRHALIGFRLAWTE